MDTVRKAENRALAAIGDKRLAGSKYLWLLLSGASVRHGVVTVVRDEGGERSNERSWRDGTAR
ncbi:MAG: hypothetical protein ABSG43_30925 [Solirubrobacteraceae bacterium]